MQGICIDVSIFLMIFLFHCNRIELVMLNILLFSSQHDAYGDRSSKHPPLDKSVDAQLSVERPQVFMPGDILYPCPSNTRTLQKQMAKENRMLWAALTPHGTTRHFVTAGEPAPNYDSHYEVVDYPVNKMHVREPTLKKLPIKVCICTIL